MRDVVTVLFPGFETLDAFGPVEVLGRLPGQFRPAFFSAAGGLVTSSQNVPVMTCPFSEIRATDCVLLVPGGPGVKDLVDDTAFAAALRALAGRAGFILTVCTGSILLSRTGLLDGKRATTNKRLFAWTKSAPGVRWVKKARWVRDGTIYTSSGVSAGTDMALGFIADQLGHAAAEQVSRETEYAWNGNPGEDPFAELYP